MGWEKELVEFLDYMLKSASLPVGVIHILCFGVKFFKRASFIALKNI